MASKRDIHVVTNPDLFVPHRVVRVGVATLDGNDEVVPADTVKDPVGRQALAKANEAIRDLPIREKIVKVNLAGEKTGVVHPHQQSSMMTPATGDIYPGEHRYAYQVVAGDRLMHLGTPDAMFGRWVNVLDIDLAKNPDGSLLNATITGITETGNMVKLHMQANAQVRLINEQEL